MHKDKLQVKCVLFDLDGTLADTSQDMCDSLNRVLESRRLKQVNCMKLKKYISRGAIGIIEYASEVNGKSVDSSLLRSEFLEDYKNNCFIKTELNKKEKIVQVKYKIKYLGAIKSGIIQNKTKIPNLSEAENMLNLVLQQYGQRKIILS